MLEGLSDASLQQVSRLIFSSLVIESDKRGRSTKGRMVTYQFTQDFEELAQLIQLATVALPKVLCHNLF